MKLPMILALTAGLGLAAFAMTPQDRPQDRPWECVCVGGSTPIPPCNYGGTEVCRFSTPKQK